MGRRLGGQSPATDEDVAPAKLLAVSADLDSLDRVPGLVLVGSWMGTVDAIYSQR